MESSRDSSKTKTKTEDKQTKSEAVNTKVRAHRDRLRAQGLRPIQIWVPDVRAPAFRQQAHRQSQAVAASAHASENQAFIDAVSVVGEH